MTEEKTVSDTQPRVIMFTTPGKPIAQKRPRFARVGKGVRTYSDQHTEAGKFLLSALKAMPDEPIKGAIRLSCVFSFARPKSHYGSGKNALILKDSAPVYMVQKPDTSNCLKFVEDCLNGHAWVDDSQVIDVQAVKCWGDGGGGGYTSVIIKEI